MWDTEGQLILEEFYENGLREGVYNSWHSNGIKKTTVNYNKGEFDGIYKELQANGNIGREIYYNNGLVNGDANIYSTDGILTNKTLFINNIKNGSFYIRYTDSEDGTAEPYTRKGIHVDDYIEGDVLNSDIEDDGSITLSYIENYSRGIMKSRTQYYDCPYDNGFDCFKYKGWMETYDDSGERISREVYKY